MSEREELAAAVAAAMDAAYDFSNYRWPQQEDCPRIADLLMPVVELIANQRAASELRAAADDLASPAKGAAYQVWAYGGGDWLRARAAELDAS